MTTGRIRRTCIVCGRLTEDGTARCAIHKHGGGRPRRCVECGRLTTGANYCPDHEHIAEQRSRERQTWRRGYRDPAYAKNKARRYIHAGGRCEDCGVPIKGHLFPNGAPWECDHVDPLSECATIAQGNAESNLRCRCLDCHHDKTRNDRRGRGGAR